MKAILVLAAALLFPFGSSAEPLSRDAVPAPLKTWVPWVMHGHETIACPMSHAGGDERVCAWPSELTLDLGKRGGTFSYRVEAFANGTWIALPGDHEQWPQNVRDGAMAIPVLDREGVPHVRLPAGSYSLTGTFAWQATPQSLKLPVAIGIIHARFDGKALNVQPDEAGLLWLHQEGQQDAPDALSIQVFRLVDDNIPMVVTTQFDLVAAGRPREVVLPFALLEQFTALSLESPLPARLMDDGQLRVQVRPGNWRIVVGSRRMNSVTELSLPKTANRDDEVWAFRAHHDVRLVALDGGQSVDPKQTTMQEQWKSLPAFRMTPGDVLRMKVARRGEGGSAPDKLTLHRQAWLDFAGTGYTLQDTISGDISRSWRLEVEPGVELGRVAVDGEDQPITRLSETDGYGIEVREGKANIVADSRRVGDVGELPGTSWNADFSSVQTVLNVPPGWRLIHASGVDRTIGSWISQWDLWAFFFVLLSALAAGRLFGVLPGIGCALALVLSWHLDGAPRLLWPGVLGLVALERVLPPGRLRWVALAGKRVALATILLMLLALAVTLVRQSIYPSLEYPGASNMTATGNMIPMAAPAPVPAPAPASEAAFERQGPEEEASTMSRMDGYLASKSAAPPQQQKFRQKQMALDPSARVQTGPGLPTWHWRRYALSWSGPVEHGQNIGLWLLPPAGTTVMNLLTVVLVGYLFWVFVGNPARAGRGTDYGRRSGQGPGQAAMLLLLALVCFAMPLDKTWAAVPVAAQAAPTEAQAASTSELADKASPAGAGAPSAELMQALRDKLTEAPDCLPNCADLAQLHLMADASAIRLRLQIHAQVPLMAPLPGQKSQFAADKVLLDGKPAVLRRDEEGVLWVRLHQGVNDLTLESSATLADTVQITLPLSPRQLTTTLTGWSLAGLDARGEAGNALTLTREMKNRRSAHEGGTQVLPPFVRITRSLVLADRWTMTTSITREGPSPLPLEVRVPLLTGEAVTDPEVRVEKGIAVVVLGQSQGATFNSSVSEVPALRFEASQAPNQIETWQVDADPRWHVVTKGIDPVRQRDEGGHLAPVWQPWAGETVELAVSRPKGVEGQTLTVDGLSISFNPGQRATDVSATLSLRSSQGRNHVLELPEGVQLQSVSIDNKTVPIRAQGRSLTLPISPGAHHVALEWREPRGMTTFFESSDLKLNASGVNANVEMQIPTDRVVLALRGPVLGPAVLFWGVLLVLVAGAWVLKRLRIAPLSFAAWVLLALGLVQSSIISVAIVAGWFACFGARQRFASRLSGRYFKLAQIALVAWSILALGALLMAIHAGLLGYPDLMIEGNGSSSHRLSWFADRVSDAAPGTWVVSIPLWTFRIAMLLWALWLARAMLTWVKWGWSAFSTGGYWPPPGPATKRSWFGRKRKSTEEEESVQTSVDEASASKAAPE